MFHKFRHHFDKVKDFLGRGYAHGKTFLGHLDNAYRTGKEIYNIVQPALHSLAPHATSHATKHLNHAASAYENIKHNRSIASDIALLFVFFAWQKISRIYYFAQKLLLAQKEQ